MNVAQWLPSKWGALVLVLLAIGAGVSLRRLQMDTRIDRMVRQEDEAAARYRDFKEAYGQDEFVLVALSGKDVFEVGGLDAMVATLDQLEESAWVGSVSGIPQIFMDLYGGEDPEALREEITSTPFYEGFFISPDETMAGMVIEAADLSAKGARSAFLADVEAALQPLKEYGYEVDLVSAVVLGEELRRYSMEESKRFFPIALVVSLAILLALLRSVRAAGVVLICALVTILLMLGTIALSGRPLNVVTVSFPLILWMLTLANGIHIVTRYQFHLRQDKTPLCAVKASLREVAFPCFLSAVTTAFGFVSLARSDVQPIREFGLIMALGMIYAFGVNVVLGSHLLVLFRAGSPRWITQGDGAPFRRIGQWTLRRPWGVIAMFLALVVWGGYSLTQVRGERNTLSFLPEETPAVKSFYRVAGSLTGMYTMEVLVDTPGSWLDTHYWDALSELSGSVASMEHVVRVVSPLDYLRKIRQWEEGPGPEAYRLPDTREEAEELVALVRAEEGSGLRRFVREDGEQVRLTALLSTADAGVFFDIDHKIQAALGTLPEPLSGYVTGRTTRMQRMQIALIESQRKSFTLAFVLVFVSILAGLRSVRLLLVSVVPNLMPILSIFTLMVLMDIPLDAGTVMVASIALGVAVDDTVHILAGYMRHRKQGEDNRGAILSALASVGPSITVTSLTASAGFFILATSVFRPLSNFGLASGVAILIAYLADLYFVPAILGVAGNRREESGVVSEPVP